MGTVGDAYDNAMAESALGSIVVGFIIAAVGVQEPKALDKLSPA